MSTTLCAHQQQPGPPLDPVHDWGELRRTDAVEVRRHDLATSGQVDVCSPDGSVLWILQDHGLGRIMIHESDGFAVYRHPC
ncbi:hypothetical protein [Pseudarthrobacter cellobiosi]|uniref:hypothetical protein n=1 Tax=Pseudarthrobacter cellobiosi TaxID=2953654 RepID=UPI00208FD125|nr:hypothetical protein [Pseudarthrobacter sp. HLT1-5]MCO4255965.1 hypothetical protein [Pseudarthrobacter sp. HLT1-5]